MRDRELPLFGNDDITWYAVSTHRLPRGRHRQALLFPSLEPPSGWQVTDWAQSGSRRDSGRTTCPRRRSQSSFVLCLVCGCRTSTCACLTFSNCRPLRDCTDLGMKYCVPPPRVSTASCVLMFLPRSAAGAANLELMRLLIILQPGLVWLLSCGRIGGLALCPARRCIPLAFSATGAAFDCRAVACPWTSRCSVSRRRERYPHSPFRRLHRFLQTTGPSCRK